MVILRRGLPPGVVGSAVLMLLLAGWTMSPNVVRGILRERVFDHTLPLLRPRASVASALALLGTSEEIRQSPLGQRLQLGRPRIGIETGPAIVGDVGGSRKLDYTAHGNAMNAAARLEAANRSFGSSICIGPGTAMRLDPATLRRIGALTPHGQSQQICVYTPVTLAPTVSPADKANET